MDPLSITLAVLLGIVAIITILALIVWPIIFWASIIPKIETRYGKKLKFDSKYSYWPFGRYLFGYVEVGTTIALMYIAKNFGERFLYGFYKNSALVAVGYDVRQASRQEILTSVIFLTSKILFALSILLMFLVPHVFPVK